MEPIELSSEHILLLSALLGFLVGEGVQSLGRLIGRDLSGHVPAITAALTGLLVATVNGLIAFVPTEHIVWVRVLLGAVLIVFGPAGVHSVLKGGRR